MLAELRRELPRGPYLYEPKYDGFRCVAFVDGGAVDLRSRHGKPFARYFPELVDALAPLGDAVVDGEIVIEGADGFDFAALMLRTHPAASRVAKLAAETPATFIAFDLLAEGDVDLMRTPFAERRERLVRKLEGLSARVRVTEATEDPAEAARWIDQRARFDGVVAKHRELVYAPGKRAMLKFKPQHTADCVVAGMRLFGPPPEVASLLLGLWDGESLRHVGVVSQLADAKRKALVAELEPDVVPLEGHPWERGFGLERSPMGRLPGAAGRWDPAEMERDWVPLAPRRVLEVAYDHLDGQRFRHPARFVRWRPDREPRSCTFEQLA
jgi:ATP-dependent DNA ligase